MLQFRIKTFHTQNNSCLLLLKNSVTFDIHDSPVMLHYKVKELRSEVDLKFLLLILHSATFIS